MSTITTHVLDTSLGRPAAGIRVRLESEAGEGTWNEVGKGITDDNGRVKDLVRSASAIQAGVYRLIFDTEPYFAKHHVQGFYREVSIVFTIRDPSQHYHVPLLLSPFGYSTYRGS